ncbi:MAG: hypothetical protein KKI08_18080 [Armatimonadetes bacterium]|nr:hypothetical protein [Armatimonadota bacterium]
MTRRRVLIVGAALLAGLVALGVAYLLGRPTPTDQQKIYALVAQGQGAVEQRNATGLTRLISRDYFDRTGTTRQQLVGMIVQWMHGGEEVMVVPEISGLDLRGDFADMSLRVRLWRGNEPSGPGEEYAMAVRLRKEGRDWKVISAEGWAEAQSDLMSGP